MVETAFASPQDVPRTEVIMSRLALLVGAVPQRCTQGPIVRLLPGQWVLRVEGLRDSTLRFNAQDHAGDTSLVDGTRIGVLIPCDFQVEFVKRGTEPFINVFAERQ